MQYPCQVVDDDSQFRRALAFGFAQSRELVPGGTVIAVSGPVMLFAFRRNPSNSSIRQFVSQIVFSRFAGFLRCKNPARPFDGYAVARRTWQFTYLVDIRREGKGRDVSRAGYQQPGCMSRAGNPAQPTPGATAWKAHSPRLYPRGSRPSQARRWWRPPGTAAWKAR